MAAQYLTYVRTEPTPAAAGKSLIESRQLRDQPFRIYRAVPELTKITIYARHVFYDLMDNMLKSYKPAASSAGSVVVQNISSKCLTEHDFTFYSDLTSTADEVEFENINPVDALLGEGGVVEKYGGELARDWFDAFLSPERFSLMLTAYEEEQVKLRVRNGELMELITAEQEISDGANQFVSLVRQFTDIQALTPEIVAAFIEKVYVHDAVTIDGKKQQEIMVVYNFIGDMK